eukprot:1157933-Pelagomonas_calceolata.AAC.4
MQVYGLHENANISKDISQTQELLDTLLLTGGARNEGQSGQSDEALVAAMAKDILTRLPPVFDVEKAQAKFPVKYEESMNQGWVMRATRISRTANIGQKVSRTGKSECLKYKQVRDTLEPCLYQGHQTGFLALSAVPRAVPGNAALQPVDRGHPQKPCGHRQGAARAAGHEHDLGCSLQELMGWTDEAYVISEALIFVGFSTFPVRQAAGEIASRDYDKALSPFCEGKEIHTLFVPGSAQAHAEEQKTLAIGAVPGLWKAQSYPSLKPLAPYVCVVDTNAVNAQIAAYFLIDKQRAASSLARVFPWMLFVLCALLRLTSVVNHDGFPRGAIIISNPNKPRSSGARDPLSKNPKREP